MDQQLLDLLPEETFDLGKPQAVYRPAHPLRGAVLGILLSLLFLGAGVAEPVLVLANGGDPVWCGFAAALLFLGILLLVLILTGRRLCVVSMDDGLVHILGRHVETYHWDEIERVCEDVRQLRAHGIPVGKFYQYTLERRDGLRLILSSGGPLKDLPRLGATLLDQTRRHLYPQARKAYQQGRTVWFGKLGISQDGLHFRGAVLSWEDLEALNFDNGALNVRKKDQWWPWCGLWARNVPNLYVFLALVERARAG